MQMPIDGGKIYVFAVVEPGRIGHAKQELSRTGYPATSISIDAVQGPYSLIGTIAGSNAAELIGHVHDVCKRIPGIRSLETYAVVE